MLALLIVGSGEVNTALAQTVPGKAKAAPAQAAAPAPRPAAVLVEGFDYQVDGLRIRGIVCRPDGQAGRPLLNMVHGGLDSPVDKNNCRRFARLGYVVAASALRGQGGSEGKPEVCGREVDDVQTLRDLVQERYRTDARRVAYLGVSLGGCIAVKAAAREGDVRAVVTLLSPTNFAEQLDLLRPTRPDAVARWEALLGGPYRKISATYEERRPMQAVSQLQAPLLTVAAGNDPLIPLQQSCAVRDARRAAGREVTEVRQNKDGTPGALPDKPWRRCDGEAPGAQLGDLRDQDVLLVYGDLGHTSTPLMWKAAEAYLAANIEPPSPSLFERLRDFFRRSAQ
ncbi:alpha/beta hydrolase family protein [Deinococcus peraridilitoris]|uniref:X-Pro dipeptidyl-peptidase (S15 family) n=1 Tax=Deinococcus peraridilitoris (strain DSM 19664 / LMG 22246 / CIP 109416 / KR-200) TaxID=937777 RepID=L0A2X9_DEIPD|nr:alpha/beta fold hydrolase [Deinococcus peraridilitoris]AFZ68191.1 X-Pro dipeptidyl-peptidase (S15 family) [Deinococcus peraridilitoris DSM 19664]